MALVLVWIRRFILDFRIGSDPRRTGSLLPWFLWRHPLLQVVHCNFYLVCSGTVFVCICFVLFLFVFFMYSVADPGCLSRLRIFPSRIQGQKDSGSRIHIKEFKYFNPKKLFASSRNMIRDVHPGSWTWFLTHPGSRIQGSKRHRIPDQDPQHCSMYTLVMHSCIIFNIF